MQAFHGTCVFDEKSFFEEEVDGEVEEEEEELDIELKYDDRGPVISDSTRISKPGRRVYSGAERIPYVHNGLGISIISTSKGVMTDTDAREQKVGGEIICKVF